MEKIERDPDKTSTSKDNVEKTDKRPAILLFVFPFSMNH